MIKSLELINHESHKHTILEFSPGLNVFVGATDAGKSSAFRAAYWLFFNRPLGDSMLPLFWKGDTRVIGTFSNPDCQITRMKGKGLNHYQLNDKDPINAGSGPPPDIIAEAIRMDDVNFQTQVDRAFLMFESPGERGRILNRIAGLDDIDRVMSNAKSDELRLSKEYQNKRALIEDLEAELKQFEDIEEREQKLLVCEQLEKHILNSWNRSRKLKGLIEKIKQVDSDLEAVEKVLKSEIAIKQARSLLESISEKASRVLRIRKIIARTRRIDGLLGELKAVPEIEERILELKGLEKKIVEHENRVKKIRRIIRQSSIISQREIEIENEMKLLETEIVKEKKNQPKICPACGQVVKN